MCKLTGKSGFTLVEALTAVLIAGVMVPVIYFTFITNWSAYQERIVRANLWADANRIISDITTDARSARRIDVASTEGGYDAQIYNEDSELAVTYSMTAEGKLQVIRPAMPEPEVLSENLDMTQSSLQKTGKDMLVRLHMKDKVFGRTVRINSESEIYPRNARSYSEP